MILYNALPRKEYERVFMCKTAKDFLISDEETINSGFTRFNVIVTSLKSLEDYSSKNHVRKFLRTLPLKWRANDTANEEAKDLATLPLDDLTGNLKGTKEVKAQDIGEVAKIAAEKVTSLVSVQSPKKTRPLLEELGVIVKTVMNLKITLIKVLEWKDVKNGYNWTNYMEFCIQDNLRRDGTLLFRP
ncbi:hypothetical protein Tco_0735649 [Tanacetum coccineum]